MVYITFVPTYAHIERYQADKQRFIEFGGSDNKEKAKAWFIAQRWPDGVACPFCESPSVAEVANRKP